MKLQKLQSSIEQQARVRNEIQQLERYIEPKKDHQRNKSYEINETKNRLLEIVNEIDEEIVDANERQQDHTYNYSFNKSKDYREENDND